MVANPIQIASPTGAFLRITKQPAISMRAASMFLALKARYAAEKM
jgi:hypothetical protein